MWLFAKCHAKNQSKFIEFFERNFNSNWNYQSNFCRVNAKSQLFC